MSMVGWDYYVLKENQRRGTVGLFPRELVLFCLSLNDNQTSAYLCALKPAGPELKSLAALVTLMWPRANASFTCLRETYFALPACPAR